ncbi:MAG TPA: 2-phosphosulfolactate phosphatase [Bacillota bacterium]|nr:2-phosphosulfolactate phosphatase [Bacillota bacterium]
MNKARITLDVALTIDSATSLDRKGCAVCVIDVLRATSTIAKALDSGAEAVYPVSGIDAARAAASELAPALLCGERLGVRPEGFDLGNSPLEYTKERVAGKRIVLATTNGTKALGRYCDADRLCAGSLLNATAVAEYLLSTGKDIILVSAGQDGAFGAEDAICAGLIAERIAREGAEYTDSAWAAITAYKACRHDMEGSVRKCDHAVYLEHEGFGDDIGYCSKTDIMKVVPVAAHHNGRIAIKKA